MKRFCLVLICFSFLQTASAKDADSDCKHAPLGTKLACHRLHQIWNEGRQEFYFSGYAWHNRYVYDRYRINRYNELAWGGGLGKGFFDEDGDWHGLYAIAFLDSHKNVEPAAGYAFLKTWHFQEQAHVGIGFTVLVTARPDILHNIPFPGALPWVSAGYQHLSISATYIPGNHQTGHVLYALGKWTF